MTYPNPLAVLSLSAFLVLTACGSKKENFSMVGRGPGGGTVNLPSTNYLLGECTRVATNTQGFSGQISTYYSGGSIVQDYLQLNIATYPAAQLTSTSYAQLYRWKESTPGSRQVNSIPVRFYYVHKISGIQANSTPLNLISRSSIQKLIADQNLDDIGVTAANFFQNYYLVLTGMEYQWEAMTVAFYDSAEGTTSIGSAEVLLPPFYASPVVYSAVVPIPSLQALHPLAHLKSSGASEAEFKRLSDEICLELFGQVRAPASVAPPVESIFVRVWRAITSWF
jgi:hypothetical protein